MPTTPMTGRRRLTQSELDMMMAAHERFLSGKPGGKRAALRFLNLTGLDFSGRNLADADLSDLDEALRHLSLVPTAERGPAWYAYSNALLEARANLEKP